ncbi:unnamed protein product [Vicia faba]|uniref:CCHC-type domain-containing protein n=1 Tax=Vicia faba TaxID=3906 RepID=A0AAV0ZSX0_VICFA|nr:unnamed protein product [Vicia faba]
MTSATLFGKLQEYETELARLKKHEIQVKDSKDIALMKSIKNHDSNQEDESNSSEDDDLIKKIKKFLRKERKREAPTRKVTCFECGEKGHVKSECPTLEKKKNYFKRNKEKKSKKAYMERENSSSDFESNQRINIALMDSHHSDDEIEEVSNEFSLYDNDVQGSIDELLNECKNFYKTVSIQKVQIISLEEKIDTMKKNFEIEK